MRRWGLARWMAWVGAATLGTGAACGGGDGVNGQGPGSHCGNGAKDADETGKDCGGATCAKCPGGEGCVHAKDCASGSCTNGLCDAAACDDGMQGGDETDVDCGGAACPKCAAGKACLSGDDCITGVCNNNTCKLAKTCSNGAKDGAETDVDCGGTCDKCSDGKKCGAAGDCQSGMCNGGTCGPAASCMDGKLNGSETDVDCGGGCAKCADGKTCKIAADCTNANCSNGLCCGTNLGNCDNNPANGCEAKLDSDAKNCGKCGMACGAGTPVCSTSKCQPCGTDCFGQAGCLTDKGKCITFTCRPGGALANFCQTCKGLKDVNTDQWFNGGYCQDVIAAYRKAAGFQTMCGNNAALACCGGAASCAGTDNAWHLFNVAANGTYYVGPSLGDMGAAGSNCSTWNLPIQPSDFMFGRLTVCEH